MPEQERVEQKLSAGLLWTLTATSTFSVANICYSHPLLSQLSETFQQNLGITAVVPMLTQFGYVVGLFLISPLGDVVERRMLISALLFASAMALAAGALAPSFLIFLFASFCIGASSVVVQIIVPFIGYMSEPTQRGRNLGIVLGGALLGALIARVLSGFIADEFGWRAVFIFGSSVMASLSLGLRIGLPSYQSKVKISYLELVASIWKLFCKYPRVRAVSMSGALIYGSLSVFWASLSNLLESPSFRMGPKVAGSFGLIGAIGVIAASCSGRFAERLGPRKIVRVCIGLMVTAYILFLFWGESMLILILGVILLDLGTQSSTVSNQTELYGFDRDAQTRINTVYKICYFFGGALGSGLAGWGWAQVGWKGVCYVGLSFLAAATAWELLSFRIRHPR